MLKPQKTGRGLVAGGAVRLICDLAGIKNVSSKILSGSKNKLNNARATMEALRQLKAKK
jgi:small subunit ribosomal protein S5